MEWAQERADEGAGKEGDLQYLLNFMKQEIETERRERAETLQVSSDKNAEEKMSSIAPKLTTAADKLSDKLWVLFQEPSYLEVVGSAH